ncbi:MAG: thioredoxin domain-containing protein [Acidiferrobacterales bacterium]
MYVSARVCLPLLLFVSSQFLLVEGAHALVNQLAGHASPYLAMHADDPVAWQDWNQAAVDRARHENKLLYVSIGYFSCHWCHVMQRESYRNKDIAKFLNTHFVPVKVDRELEPALDARMIEFVEAIQGRAGWPLNVFITPEGHPLYAVLYLPPHRFLQVVQRLHSLWEREREELEQLARGAKVTANIPNKPPPTAEEVEQYADQIERMALAAADSINGGFGRAAKFPSVPQLDFLLDRWESQPDTRIKDFLRVTLDRMANGGLYDHLGSGFFRYTTDPAWKTPHFEKMLYDNALLAQLYLRAARAFKHPTYEEVAHRTLAFLINELRTPTGAFVASLSAVDDSGKEGGYYLWNEARLRELLGPRERRAASLYWGMTGTAPFDSGYLPVKVLTPAEVAERMELGGAEVEQLLARAERKLYQARAQRDLPKDTKLLAGWNGLVLSAFAYAARVTDDDQYRRTAKGVRDYLLQQLWDGQSLRRAVRHGKAFGHASLEDYAYVAQGLLDWAESTGREPDFANAQAVVSQAWTRFYSLKGWHLAAASLIEAERAQVAILDGPMPSPSAILAGVTMALAARSDDERLRAKAISALSAGQERVQRNPLWNATHVRVMLANIPSGRSGSD